MSLLRHRVAFVGRRAKDPWLDVADGYVKKLQRQNLCELVSIRDGDTARERQALLCAPRPNEYVIALDERGKMLSTAQWHEAFVKLAARQTRSVCWLIGGSEGLGDDVRKRCDALWALSALTLPHRGALAVLLEQLYRCEQIAKGTPYHRAG